MYQIYFWSLWLMNNEVYGGHFDTDKALEKITTNWGHSQ